MNQRWSKPKKVIDHSIYLNSKDFTVLQITHIRTAILAACVKCVWVKLVRFTNFGTKLIKKKTFIWNLNITDTLINFFFITPMTGPFRRIMYRGPTFHALQIASYTFRVRGKLPATIHEVADAKGRLRWSRHALGVGRLLFSSGKDITW